MKPCSNPLCTNQVDDNDRFCGLCGTYVGPDITQVGKQCVNCGRTLQPRQTFCSDCGAFTTLVMPQPTVSMDSQASIPTQSITPILPPLKVATITPEELQVVWRTSKNVYAPYMRHLVDFHIPDFSEDFVGSKQVGVLMRDLEATDFTFQTDRLGIEFVFRFDTHTGEGYRFCWREGKTLIVEIFHTRSKLTGETLPESNVSQTILSYPLRYQATHLIALVAQKTTLDLYDKVVHLGRVENATILQGKLGFYLPNTDFVRATFSRREEEIGNRREEEMRNRREKEWRNFFDNAKVWIP